MSNNKVSLSPEIIKILEELFDKYEVSFTKPKAISEFIISLSKNYQNELTDHSNIWAKPHFVKAYLAYFLPLNILRLTSVMNEVKSFINLDDIGSFYDYGSGPGTGQFSIKNAGTNPSSFFNFDKSKSALNVHQAWSTLPNNQFTTKIEDWDNIKPNSLGIFSYAFNEIETLPEIINKHDHILILEPSNQMPARRLQQHRSKFNKLGYNVIAPCTHQGECPLLKHSKKDWCHNRVFTDLPPWFAQLDKFLPMKNTNITYSYLFVSKTIQPITNELKGRVIGDSQKEKGKTRQAFCRNSDREFLSWLKKDGKVEQVPRGSLYELSPDHIKKANEIRKS